MDSPAWIGSLDYWKPHPATLKAAAELRARAEGLLADKGNCALLVLADESSGASVWPARRLCPMDEPRFWIWIGAGGGAEAYCPLQSSDANPEIGWVLGWDRVEEALGLPGYPEAFLEAKIAEHFSQGGKLLIPGGPKAANRLPGGFALAIKGVVEEAGPLLAQALAETAAAEAERAKSVWSASGLAALSSFETLWVSMAQSVMMRRMFEQAGAAGSFSGFDPKPEVPMFPSLSKAADARKASFGLAEAALSAAFRACAECSGCACESAYALAGENALSAAFGKKQRRLAKLEDWVTCGGALSRGPFEAKCKMTAPANGDFGGVYGGVAKAALSALKSASECILEGMAPKDAEEKMAVRLMEGFEGLGLINGLELDPAEKLGRAWDRRATLRLSDRHLPQGAGIGKDEEFRCGQIWELCVELRFMPGTDWPSWIESKAFSWSAGFLVTPGGQPPEPLGWEPAAALEALEQASQEHGMGQARENGLY